MAYTSAALMSPPAHIMASWGGFPMTPKKSLGLPAGIENGLMPHSGVVLRTVVGEILSMGKAVSSALACSFCMEGEVA